MKHSGIRIFFIVLLCVFTARALPLVAQAVPPEWYSLSADGLTLERWKGDTAVVNLAADPQLSRIESIAPFAFIKLDSTGHSTPDYTLERLFLPPRLKRIGRAAFWSVNLREIRFNEGLLYLEYRCFREPAVREIGLPASLRHYDQSFFRANHLELINVATDSRYFCVRSHCLLSTTDNTLLLYPGGLLNENPTLPDRISTIGEASFAFNPVVKKLRIPEGVTEIRADAFLAADELRTLLLPSSLRTIAPRARLYTSIDTIYCSVAFPPKLELDPSELPLPQISLLVVPDGAIAVYGQNPVWALLPQSILTETEFETKRNATQSTQQERFVLVDRVLTLHIEDIHNEAFLFDKDGNMAYRFQKSGSYPLLPGIYMLRIGAESYKLVVPNYDGSAL